MQINYSSDSSVNETDCAWVHAGMPSAIQIYIINHVALRTFSSGMHGISQRLKRTLKMISK